MESHGRKWRKSKNKSDILSEWKGNIMWILLLLAGVAAFFCVQLLFGNSIQNVVNAIRHRNPKMSLKRQASHKENWIVRAVTRTKTMLSATGQRGKFYALLLAALLLFMGGLFLGTVSGNYFLAPVLAFGLAAVPFVYLRFQYLKFQRLMLDELETALSVISVSYERTENILQAVEENIDAIQAPIRQVFKEFLRRVKLVDPDIEAAIDEMKTKINHSVFYEWCDALKRCNQDRSLKHTLRPIVSKLTSIKIVTNDLKNILYRPLRTYWELAAASVGVLYIGLKVVPDSLMVTLPSTVTQVLIAVNALLIFMTAIITMLETHEIKFDL